ncbi:MAG: alpha amylase C-terminal domain-containing protein, partial [Eubacteriales bacterium]|nr:alpha amylase C-terminal domain-containing protein [Eubacteriales bacterium]
LGFDYKWDLGWMHDTLSYFQTEPARRPDSREKLTFSMHYYYNERYLLPLSHDEVVHGKATILQKMYGDYQGKFPQGRAFYLYMMAHPGKKLNFMGNEFGQLREWDESREQDWCLLSFPIHDAFLRFMRELNKLYLSSPAMYQEDYSPDGFQWLSAGTVSPCVFAFERRCSTQRMAFVFNLSDKPTGHVQLPAPENINRLIPVIHTDWEEYGGASVRDTAPLACAHGMIEISLSAYSGAAFLAEL